MFKEIRDLRYASYIIPVRIRDGVTEIAQIEYEPGAYGSIGGRFEDDDTDARAALRRELCEELNPDAVQMADTAIQVAQPYRFDVAPERVAIRHARREVHYFFVTRVPNDLEIRFCEQCPGNVHIVWLPVAALTDRNVVRPDDMREYIATHILPMIDAL